MAANIKLFFATQPPESHEFFFSYDARKDTLLINNDGEPPIVIFRDESRRNGVLLVACVDSEPITINNTHKYRLHVNKLIDFKNQTSYCDEFGVAKYKLEYDSNNEASIILSNLTIRRFKEDLSIVAREWDQNAENKFDPYGVGFGFIKINGNLEIIEELKTKQGIKGLNLQSLRLCCKIVFDDSNEGVQPIVSNKIHNCKSSIEVHKWDDDLVVNASGGDYLSVFVSELKPDQRKIYGAFYDNDVTESYRTIQPDFIHCNRTIRFIVPPCIDNSQNDYIRSKFHLAVQNKLYISKDLYFYYKKCKCQMTKPDEMFKAQKRHLLSSDLDDDSGIKVRGSSTSSKKKSKILKKTESNTSVAVTDVNSFINDIGDEFDFSNVQPSTSSPSSTSTIRNSNHGLVQKQINLSTKNEENISANTQHVNTSTTCSLMQIDSQQTGITESPSDINMVNLTNEQETMHQNERIISSTNISVNKTTMPRNNENQQSQDSAENSNVLGDDEIDSIANEYKSMQNDIDNFYMVENGFTLDEIELTDIVQNNLGETGQTSTSAEKNTNKKEINDKELLINQLLNMSKEEYLDYLSGVS